MRGSRTLASFGGTVLLRQIARRILGPVVDASIKSSALAWGSLPLPVTRLCNGARPDRILLFGAAGVAGLGVSSNELGLGGQLARALSALTGRGTELEIDGQQSRSVASSTRDFAGTDLSRYDALIIQVGVRAAIGLKSARIWRRDIRVLTRQLEATMPLRLALFFVGIPPLPRSIGLPKIALALASRHERVSISNRARFLPARACTSCPSIPRTRGSLLATAPSAPTRHGRAPSLPECAGHWMPRTKASANPVATTKGYA